MDNKTYNKIQEMLNNIENQFHQLGRDIKCQPIEKEKAFGVIFLKGDNEGCTTQILSTPTIAAKMILQCISNHPEVAQEIKRIQTLQKLERIQALQKLERLTSFFDAVIRDNDDDDKNEEEEECEE